MKQQLFIIFFYIASAYLRSLSYDKMVDYMSAGKEGFTGGATKCRPLTHDTVPISSMQLIALDRGFQQEDWLFGYQQLTINGEKRLVLTMEQEMEITHDNYSIKQRIHAREMVLLNEGFNFVQASFNSRWVTLDNGYKKKVLTVETRYPFDVGTNKDDFGFCPIHLQYADNFSYKPDTMFELVKFSRPGQWQEYNIVTLVQIDHKAFM